MPLTVMEKCVQADILTTMIFIIWVKKAMQRPAGCAWIMMKITNRRMGLFLKSVLLLLTLPNGSTSRQTARPNVLKMIPTLQRPLGIINTILMMKAL